MSLPKQPTLATTTSAAMSDDVQDIGVGSIVANTIFPGDVVIVGAEMMRIVTVSESTARLFVQRGVEGTRAAPHASGVAAYAGARSLFDVDGRRPYLRGYAGVLGERALMKMPLRSFYVDPDTGYEYRLCRAGTTLAAGDWVSFDERVLVGDTRVAPKGDPPDNFGMVGIAIEVAPAAQQHWCWILVRGQYETAKAGTIASADVLLGLGSPSVAGAVETYAALDGARVFNAGNTAASSGGRVPVIINRPFIDGFV